MSSHRRDHANWAKNSLPCNARSARRTMAPNYLALPFHAILPQRFLDGQRAAFEVFQYAPRLFFYACVAFFERHVCQRAAMYAGEFGRRVQVVFLQNLGVRATACMTSLCFSGSRCARSRPTRRFNPKRALVKSTTESSNWKKTIL